MRTPEQFKEEIYTRTAQRKAASSRRRRILLSTVGAVALATAITGTAVWRLSVPAAAQDLTQGITPGTVQTEKPDEDFCAAQTAFALRLLQSTADSKESVIESPLSAAVALAMTENGAAGNTKSEMLSLLGGTNDADRFNRQLYTLLSSFAGRKATVTSANAIWFRDGLSIKTPFLQTNADYFGANAFASPMGDETVEFINGWVKDKTDGKIEKLVSAFDPSTVMCLVNALSFDAEWQEPYKENDTRPGIFHNANGDIAACTMMTSEEQLYLQDTNACGFMKPYKGEEYFFVALLPDEGVSAKDYVASFTPERLRALLKTNGETPAKVIASMPKFTLDSDLPSLAPILSEMGMPTAFTAAADFSPMADTDEPLYISAVVQKAHIDVNERGTSAGAATAVYMCEAAPEQPPTYVVNLDRPFVYAVVDGATRLPIFTGIVNSLYA